MTDGWGIFSEIALRWISMNPADDKSALVQVMAWCRQATSHYLSQCWLSSLSPYGITRPQWVKKKWSGILQYLVNIRCWCVINHRHMGLPWAENFPVISQNPYQETHNFPVGWEFIPAQICVKWSLKQKCDNFEICITDCTVKCDFDNFQCSQWLKFWSLRC